MADEETKSKDDELSAAQPEGELSDSAGEGEDRAELEGDGDAAVEPQNRRTRRAAASQARKARMRERREAEAVGLDAQEMLDDALVRSTDTASKWLRRHSSTLQWALVIGLVGWAGWGIYGWRTASKRANASDALALAVSTERGKIGEPAEQGRPNEQGVIDPTPIFKDRSELLAAAVDRFEQAAAMREGSGTNLYAELGLAAVLLDSGKFDEATAKYNEVKAAEFAQSDPELRGRALEGLALVQEAKGDEAAALAAYKDLENAGIQGFTELAMYQQARLSHAMGKTAEAKEIALKLREKLDGLDDPLEVSKSFVKSSLKQLADELGLEPVAPPASKPITPMQIDALQRQVQEQINAASERAKNNAPQKAQDEPASTGEGATGKDTTAEATKTGTGASTQ